MLNSGSVGRQGDRNHYDIAVIGAGPAGAATAIRAARGGARVIVFEKGTYGRDKVCGDGLTPRAIGALNDLDIDLEDSHHIVGLRMIANKTRRELDWPTTARFPNHGAVWPRRRLDAALIDAASEAGATIRWEAEALPVIEGSRVIGVESGGEKITADMTVVPSPGSQVPTATSVSPITVADTP